jgi:hypothetical protein
MGNEKCIAKPTEGELHQGTIKKYYMNIALLTHGLQVMAS